MEVFSPGTIVRVHKHEAHVVAVRVEQRQLVTYLIVYWEKMDRKEMWVNSFEVEAYESHSATTKIGFKT